MRHRRHIGILLIALLTASLPLSACSASPAPTATPMLAPTAASTPTPAPINTPLPTATATPQPSPTPTEVPSPTPQMVEIDETWITSVGTATGFSLRCPATWYMFCDTDIVAAFMVDPGGSDNLAVVKFEESNCFDGRDRDEAMACFADECLSTCLDNDICDVIDSGVWDDGVHQGYYVISGGSDEHGVRETYDIALPNEVGNTMAILYTSTESSPPQEEILETLRGVSASAVWGLPVSAVSANGWVMYWNQTGNWTVRHPESWESRDKDTRLADFIAREEDGRTTSIVIGCFDGVCAPALDEDEAIACYLTEAQYLWGGEDVVQIADNGPWDDGVNSGYYISATLDRPDLSYAIPALLVILRDDSGQQFAFQFLYLGGEGPSQEQLDLARTLTSTFVQH